MIATSTLWSGKDIFDLLQTFMQIKVNEAERRIRMPDHKRLVGAYLKEGPSGVQKFNLYIQPRPLIAINQHFNRSISNLSYRREMLIYGNQRTRLYVKIE